MASPISLLPISKNFINVSVPSFLQAFNHQSSLQELQINLSQSSNSKTLSTANTNFSFLKKSLSSLSPTVKFISSSSSSSPSSTIQTALPLTGSTARSFRFSSLLDFNSSIFGWLIDGLLRAVPKKKVSHSRKRMRSAQKGLKPELGLSRCSGCGSLKRKHFLCLSCYADKVLEHSQSPRKPWEKGITP
ncbi:hypothetical protein BY996DRAFT_6840539 [Phakopsora pachyrhizi]|uniref:Large ribosomal subunit protein bL32m n=1 Tax=Phakopsora pachyrhizi TaxID=170000 RepID=A0AAV0BQJ4_PHAPC|nr:hypothetical protein BY996DRAFT_6840539 [Phakopsora pachyrhizi]CAH7689634.1 expressed protein [Phakopsora pachyrhizi]